jgi:hypothetical protein
MENEETKSQEDIDWENRILCIDESCIGTVGSDGYCKECGKPFESKPQENIHEEQESDEPDTEEDPIEDIDSESQTDIDWGRRTLCIDESCIGVIGPDGCCKECGKPFKNG